MIQADQFTQQLAAAYRNGHRAVAFLGVAESDSEVQPVTGPLKDVEALVAHLLGRNPNFEVAGPYEFGEDGHLVKTGTL